MWTGEWRPTSASLTAALLWLVVTAGPAYAAELATPARAVPTPPTGQAPVVTADARLRAAQELRRIDQAALRPTSFGDACLRQVQLFFCPLISQIPFVRDAAGQMALWGGFDCPIAPPPG